MTSSIATRARFDSGASQVRRLLLATALLSLGTACTADHFARYEGVTPEAGNAKAVNVAQTAVDTTPAAAPHTALPADGPRMAKTIEWYRTPTRPEDNSGSDNSIENAEPRQE